MPALTAHSRKKWRAAGYFVEQAEHITRMGSIVRRHDTFGFADLIAIKHRSLVFLQVTSWGNVSARANKIAREDHGTGQYGSPMYEIAHDLLSLYDRGEARPLVRIVVEGWRRRDNRWESREIEITPAELYKRRKDA